MANDGASAFYRVTEKIRNFLLPLNYFEGTCLTGPLNYVIITSIKQKVKLIL